jgi:hypothetical protein
MLAIYSVQLSVSVDFEQEQSVSQIPSAAVVENCLNSVSFVPLQLVPVPHTLPVIAKPF